MTKHQTIPIPLRYAAAPRTSAPVAVPDDAAMLRIAAQMSRDFAVANPAIYWPDFLISAMIGYAGLAAAILLDSVPLAVLAGIVAVFALYRAASFIHELTHIRKGSLPGFRLAWNALIGVPLMIPSFLYEGVHTLHHARTRYGTADDPEYLPLALMKPWTLPVFLAVALLGPLGLILRFGIIAPLSMLSPSLRAVVRERYSALSINPAFRRRPAEGALKHQWFWQELATSLFAMALVASVFAFGWKPLLTYMAVLATMTVINQVRTLVAHLWENDGEPMSVTAQYLDSVNVPPPGLLPELWAPVGLRYHALHHLLPSVPYHALGTAHRQMMTLMDGKKTYDGANYRGLLPLVEKIVRGTMGAR